MGLFYEDVPAFVISLEGNDKETKRLIYLIAIIFEQLLDRYSKEKFLIDALAGKLEKNTVRCYADRYKLNKKSKYIVIIVESNNEIEDAIKIVTNIFNKTYLHIVKIDNRRFVVIFPYKESISLLESYKTIKDMIESEGYIKVKIASSSSLVSIEDIDRAYKEAEVALTLGQKLDNEKGIYIYDNYAFAELLWGIDINKVKNFISKKEIDFNIFKDEELVQTLNAFFKNSLNLSETSRELYIHRNTLVYRLDKIFKMTGLDPKKFDDALMLKTIMILTKLYDISG